MTAGPAPLSGVRVLDLSLQLPGPLASLILSQAGADVVKIERPEMGDELRIAEPKDDAVSSAYHLLNHGKTILAANLKDPVQLERVKTAAGMADIVIEQFRPGVAERLGVGYQDVKKLNPSVVYCSITGYGQNTPQRLQAGHDLNYLAASGLLYLTDTGGSPAVPPGAIADIAGGSYPSLVGILLALRTAENTGHGAHLDISMTHGLNVFAYAAIAFRNINGAWPAPNAGQYNGGSPRYALYRTRDGRHVAVGAVEDRFWTRLVKLLELSEDVAHSGDQEWVRTQLAARFARRPASEWSALLSDADVCCTVVATPEEAESSGLLNPTGIRAGHRFSCDSGVLPITAAPPQTAQTSRPCQISPSIEMIPSGVDGIWPPRP